MPIISKIGRKSLKVRLLIWTIYALLIAGAVTMVYPFALMVAGSTKSATDVDEFQIIPSFISTENALYAKHIEGLFNGSLEMMRSAYFSETSMFRHVEPPAEPNGKMVEEWLAFLAEADLPHYTYAVGYVSTGAFSTVTRGVVPHTLRKFKRELIEQFDGDIDELNRAMGTQFADWNALFIHVEDYLLRRNKPGKTPFDLTFRRFKINQPADSRYYFSAEGYYKTLFLRANYTRDIAVYNRRHGTNYTSYDDVHLDRRLPTGPGRTDMERTDWEEFTRTLLNLLWIRADAETGPHYHRFLKAKYRNIETLNRSYGTEYESFDKVPLVGESPDEGIVLSDWDAFLQGWKDPQTGRTYILPVELIRIHSLDFMFRDYLKGGYGSIGEMNAALGTAYKNRMEIIPPQRDAHYLAFKQKTGSLRWEFIKRNYITVIDYIVLHGRGILNTAIFCTLSIIAALLVNPLAAYALSRYKPPSTYKVLLLLMMTMAFPPMVTQIPVFLMLRDLSLLNTFWALILPYLANGYWIFLLKGFFDSLPKELYESAAIDGAGELRIFWQITMSLSKPILAVIALGAFTAAYTNFMYALLICQDEKMWTLMVWLYQLQQRSGQGVIFASLIIAAIPTFLVFALCQNVIMRGIIVPVEK